MKKDYKLIGFDPVFGYCPKGTLLILDERKELQRKDEVCSDANVGQENVSSNSQ
jgi:hypothetical protein